MERLTNRNKHGGAYYPYCFKENTCDGIGTSEKCNDCDFNTRVCEKLAEYEDIEEQGRLIKLPCKVGTTVYCLWTSFNFETMEPETKIVQESFEYEMVEYFGKTVFLTREEALAEMGE